MTAFARSLLVLATLCLTLTSCWPSAGELTVVDGDRPATSSAQWPIINGQPPDAPEHQAVVSLHFLDYPNVYVSPFCSGTLVAPDVVLTAAHCLDDANSGPSFVTMPPENLTIYVGDEPAVDILDHLYFVAETLIHPDYDRLALLNDAALVRMEAVATEAEPVPNLPSELGFDWEDVGSAINFAGFGDDEFGASGVKLQVDGLLGGLGCAVPGCPDSGDPATMVSYTQNFSIGGPCFGDSGGPLFIERDGAVYVGGMTSYGDSGCAVYGVSTRADAFETWIDAFIDDEPPVCDHSGSVSSSVRNAYVALGALAGGTPISGSLSWDSPAANLDLYLQYNNGSRWKNAASSTDGTPGVFETLAHTVPASRDGLEHRWRVRRRSGTADWCLNDEFVEPPNQAPVADPDGPYAGSVGVAVTFDGSASFDLDGTIVAWDWDFGDSTLGSGESPSHAYAALGTYTVWLTVTDDDGDSDSAQTSATVSDAPVCDYSGTVSSSHKDDYVAVGAQAAGQTLAADLSWDSSSANLDLYLQAYDGRRWRNAASSRSGSPGVPESLSYTVPSNRDGDSFRWRIRRRSGTALYCLDLL